MRSESLYYSMHKLEHILSYINMFSDDRDGFLPILMVLALMGSFCIQSLRDFADFGNKNASLLYRRGPLRSGARILLP